MERILPEVRALCGGMLEEKDIICTAEALTSLQGQIHNMQFYRYIPKNFFTPEQVATIRTVDDICKERPELKKIADLLADKRAKIRDLMHAIRAEIATRDQQADIAALDADYAKKVQAEFEAEAATPRIDQDTADDEDVARRLQETFDAERLADDAERLAETLPPPQNYIPPRAPAAAAAAPQEPLRDVEGTAPPASPRAAGPGKKEEPDSIPDEAKKGCAVV
jgi:hypothetical protein